MHFIASLHKSLCSNYLELPWRFVPFPPIVVTSADIWTWVLLKYADPWTFHKNLEIWLLQLNLQVHLNLHLFSRSSMNMSDLLSPLYILSSVYIYLPVNSYIMGPQNLHPFISPYAKKKSYHMMRFKVRHERNMSSFRCLVPSLCLNLAALF